MKALLALACALALGACGTADGPPPPGEPVVVRIWHQKDAAERDFLEAWVRDYNGQQDSVEVVLLYKETEELRNQYLFAAIGGKGPDLFYGPADNIGTLSITETARPLETLLPARFLAGFDSTGLLRYDGHLLGVADQVGNHLTFVYNKKLLPEPPRTLGALDSLGARFSAPGDSVDYALTWNYTEPFFFIPFLTSYGGWVMDDDGNPTLDTPEMVRAIQYVLDLRDKYHVIPRESDYETANTLFKDGAAASIINGPWSWAGYGEAGVDYALAPIPFNAETGLWAQPMAAAKAYSLNPGVPEWKLPAVLGLMQLLTGDAVQADMATRLSTIPVRTAVRNGPAVRDNPILQQSLAQIAHSRPMPTAPQLRQIWDGMKGPYQLVMNGQVSAEDGARLMQENVEKRITDTFLN